MNKNKSKVYFCKGALHRKHAICAALSVAEGCTPSSYLGVPIFKGKPKSQYLQWIANKIISKLEGWQGKLLFFVGKIVMIKAVIFPMLLHTFTLYIWHAKLIKAVQLWCRNFLWTGDIFSKKLVAVAWHIVCSSKLSGGLGIRHLHSFNKAALFKQMWSIFSFDSQLNSMLNCRFNFRKNYSTTTYKSSSIWPGLKQAMHTIHSHG